MSSDPPLDNGPSSVADMEHMLFAQQAEIERLRELERAVIAWREWLIEKHGSDDWKCPYVKRIMVAVHKAEKEGE